MKFTGLLVEYNPYKFELFGLVIMVFFLIMIAITYYEFTKNLTKITKEEIIISLFASVSIVAFPFIVSVYFMLTV